MRVLLPLDGSSTAECSLLHGGVMGEAFGADSVLLQVVETARADAAPAMDVLHWQLRRRQAEAYLSEVRDRFEAGGRSIETAVVEGRPAEEILRYTHAHDIDLVVMADTGRGATDPGSLGGTAAKVISRLDASILLVPRSAIGTEDPDCRYRLILVPVDGSPGSSWATRIAAAIAMASGATLMLMRVVETERLSDSAGHSREVQLLAERVTQAISREASEWLRMLRSQLPPDLDVDTRVVVAADVCRAITDMAVARQAGLLVLSARGFDHEMDWRYGSTTERLLAHTTCPILVLQHRPGAAAGEPMPGESGRWRMPSVA